MDLDKPHGGDPTISAHLVGDRVSERHVLRSYDHTITYALSALGYTRQFDLPADPASFELWYAYSTGYDGGLVDAVNDALKARGNLTVEDTDRIYEKFLSPSVVLSRLGSVGDSVGAEIDRVATMIDAAIGSASSFGHSLSGATQRLIAPVNDRESLRRISDGLLKATKSVESENRLLKDSLVASKQQIAQLQSNLEAIRADSLTDALTKLANRKHFDSALSEAIGDSITNSTPLSLLVCDVDHFKKFNDSFGHPTGDRVLRLIGVALKQTVRGQDVAARYGGEEFAIILPNTKLAHAIAVAENIRGAVMDKELVKRSTGERLGRITVSIGVAEFETSDTAESLIGRADSCMYAAKQAGRNRVNAGEKE